MFELDKKMFCVVFALFCTGWVAFALNKVLMLCSEDKETSFISVILVCSLMSTILATVLYKKMTP